MLTILWDNDGVLVDTEGLYFRATRTVLAEVGVELTPEQFKEISLKRGESTFLLALERGIPGDEITRLRAKRDRIYTDFLRTEPCLIDGAEEVLRSLYGQVRMGVVTSTHRQHFDIAHARTGLAKYFAFFFAHGDYRHSKPHPEPYLTALARHQLRPKKCIVVEDSERGLASATAAGLECLIVLSEWTKDGDFRNARKVLGSIAEVPGEIMRWAGDRAFPFNGVKAMNAMSYFDQSATTWDADPNRIQLVKAVGEAILREARPSKETDVLDYGCGTGLIGLFLLPHVRSVTGADSSYGMLDVLRKKIGNGGIPNMTCIHLDLEHDPVPEDRYHLIVTSMVLHHAADTARVLAAFHRMLHPKGLFCMADLDKEPGLFHTPEAATTVHHHGFDRAELKAQLVRAGFNDVRDTTAHTIRKPVQGGGERDFPVFLMTALN